MPGELHTVLCERLGCRFPIVQTAMGWVADARLVAATCNAGGFGFFAGATAVPGDVENQILAIKRLTEKPFGVNFHMFQPNAEEVIAAVIRQKVRAVSYGRGPDAKTIGRLRDAGVVCMPTVGALKHAVKAVELGADIVTIQGSEGGGHTGAVPTTLLLPQLTAVVGVPVVGAGGFFDGRGLVAALAWGAAGIAMGTRFLLTRDSTVPDAVKARYLAAALTDTVVTRAVDGYPQRVIRTAMVDRLERSLPGVSFARAAANALRLRKLTATPLSALIREGLAMRKGSELTWAQAAMAANAPMLTRSAMVEGRLEAGILPTGQVAGLIEELPSVAELVARIMAEGGESLDRLCAGKEARE